MSRMASGVPKCVWNGCGGRLGPLEAISDTFKKIDFWDFFSIFFDSQNFFGLSQRFANFRFWPGRPPQSARMVPDPPHFRILSIRRIHPSPSLPLQGQFPATSDRFPRKSRTPPKVDFLGGLLPLWGPIWKMGRARIFFNFFLSSSKWSKIPPKKFWSHKMCKWSLSARKTTCPPPTTSTHPQIHKNVRDILQNQSITAKKVLPHTTLNPPKSAPPHDVKSPKSPKKCSPTHGFFF